MSRRTRSSRRSRRRGRRGRCAAGDVVADIALKYTREALRIVAWPVLRHFPRGWLLECLPKAGLTESRARAVRLMLGIDGG
jgi:hypothetical protein